MERYSKYSRNMKKGHVKALNETNRYFKVIPVFKESRSIPTKNNPYSVIGKTKNGQVIQYRFYGQEVFVEKDLDLTNHGNAKEHRIVPHVHRLRYKYNSKHDKIKPRRGIGVEPSKNELDDIERWRKING